jgi:hypothetical protein
MANIAEYMPARTSVEPRTYSYSEPLTTSRPRDDTKIDDTKIRGFRLILIWLAAILLSWSLFGSLAYGGFKVVSSLLS